MIDPNSELLQTVIVAFRNYDDLRKALTLLHESSVPSACTVVDNDYQPEHAEQIRREFRDIELIDPGDNVGFGVASNAGYRRSRSELVLFLNPDVSRLPDHAQSGVDDLALCVEELLRLPDVGVLGPLLVKEDGEIDHACKRGDFTPWRMFCYVAGLDRLARGTRVFGGYRLTNVPLSRSADVDAVNGAFMLARRSAVAQVDGFDPRYWMYAEDLDLCRSIRLRGWRVRFYPDAVFVHKKGASDPGRRMIRTRQAFVRSTYLYLRKWYPGLSILRPDVAFMVLALRARLVFENARSLCISRKSAGP